MKSFQAILEEIMEISRIPMLLYDTAAVLCAATAKEDDVLIDSIQAFIASEANSQSLGQFHYFKVICSDTLSYVLLVQQFSPDAFTIGRLTVCQLKHLLESQEETITKSGFIHSLAGGNLTPVEIERQAKKLKLRATNWVVFVIECEDSFRGSYAHQLLEHAFAGEKLDLCCELDECRLLLAKDVTKLLKKQPLALFAQTLVDSLRAEVLIQTHVGYSTAVNNFQDLPRAYCEAATALRIRHTFFAERDTAAYDKLGIGRLISALPVDLCEAFLVEVFGTNIPQNLDEETQNTIQKFFENNLNVSETARQLYLHRNTLVYRLERMEKILGLDIRKFEDAMTFKLAMMVLARCNSAKE